MVAKHTGVRIYLNPRCSKCRAALEILQQQHIAVEVIEYLDAPPTREELRALLARLGMKPRDIVRSGEAVFREKYEGRTLSDEQWLDALVADPILMERPIVVRGDRAVVGRPPQRVLELF